jgi:hypothetical protein
MEKEVAEHASIQHTECPIARRVRLRGTSRRPTADNPSIGHIGDSRKSVPSLPAAVGRIRGR